MIPFFSSLLLQSLVRDVNASVCKAFRATGKLPEPDEDQMSHVNERRNGAEIPVQRTVVIVGATSAVGAEAAQALTREGHSVRRVARSLGISLDDAPALSAAFSGADSAYIMIPFDILAPDLHQFERTVGYRLIDAIAAAKLRRVVLLSGLNAHLKMGTSLGAAEMEERIDALKLPETVHLRAGFFMENFIKGMGFIEQSETGRFATPFRGDLPMPLIAAKDIGRCAARLLVAAEFPTNRILELHGGGYYTLAEATTILGAAIGRRVTYQTVPLAEAKPGMIDSGMSASFVDALIETAASFNRGERWALERPASINRTPTTLEAWAEEAFRGGGYKNPSPSQPNRALGGTQ